MWNRNQQAPTIQTIEYEFIKSRLNTCALNLVNWWHSHHHTRYTGLAMLSDAQYMVHYMTELKIKSFTYGGFCFNIDDANQLIIKEV